MNINVIGGTIGVAALVALFALHGCKRDEAPTPPAPQVTVTKPAPAKLAPASKNLCTVDHPSHTVQPTGDVKKPVYRKVLKGGQLGGPVTCDRVPAVAKQFPPDQVIAAAKQYGMTPTQLSQLRVCLKN